MMELNNLHKKQTGATLMVALMFLLMMTLFAVSSINLSTVNLKIIGNMQATKTLDASVQSVIEQLISTADTFVDTPTNTADIIEYNPATNTVVTTAVTVGGGSTATAFGTAEISDPECIDSQVAPGYSVLYPDSLQNDNVWEVIVTMTDATTGATSTIHQGTQVRMLAGNCPN